MEDGGVVPNREERDELKYEEDGRAGEGALMAIGEEIIDADSGRVMVLGLAVCNCSWISLSCSSAFVLLLQGGGS
jgi:hypothetical protein